MDQELIDALIVVLSMGTAIYVLALRESSRAKRQERRLWRRYILLSTTPGVKPVSWEQFRHQNARG